MSLGPSSFKMDVENSTNMSLYVTTPVIVNLAHKKSEQFSCLGTAHKTLNLGLSLVCSVAACRTFVLLVNIPGGMESGFVSEYSFINILF